MKQSSRGFTLIEMLVVITVGSIIMGLAATTLALLLRAEGRGAESASVTATTARLAESFRHDVRDSQEAILDGPGSLRLLLDDNHSVHYEAHKSLVRRSVHQGESVTHHDEFRLLAGEVRFEITAEGKLVALIHTNHAAAANQSAATGPSRSLRIEAALGRNRSASPAVKAK